MSGVGLYVVVSQDGGAVQMRLAVRQTGCMTPAETRARDLLCNDGAFTHEMRAAQLEELATLVPVVCERGCDIDVSELVSSIRRRTVLQ